VERARGYGVTIPIVPGLMPVTHLGQIQRLAQLSGAEFPADLAAQFRHVADDPDAVVELGIVAATALGQELLEGGAPGLHFYTLNRSTATREIFGRLSRTGAASG